MSNFQINEVVKTVDSNTERMEGIIKYITCHAATGSGGKKCDKANCKHAPKDHVWVKWPNGKLCSYDYSELENDVDGEEEIYDTVNKALMTAKGEEATNYREVLKSITKARKMREDAPHMSASRNMRESSSNSNSLMEMVKIDMTNAAYRVGAKQLNAGIRNAIVDTMKKRGADNAHIEMFTGFLETEFGIAFLSVLAGYGLTYAPMIKDNPKAQRLAQEFRVAGITMAGNEIVSTMIEQVLPGLKTMLNSLPESTDVQTTEGHKSTEEEESEIDITTDLTSLDDHISQEEKRMVQNGN